MLPIEREQFNALSDKVARLESEIRELDRRIEELRKMQEDTAEKAHGAWIRTVPIGGQRQ